MRKVEIGNGKYSIGQWTWPFWATVFLPIIAVAADHNVALPIHLKTLQYTPFAASLISKKKLEKRDPGRI